jgi:hypothetical protein
MNLLPINARAARPGLAAWLAMLALALLLLPAVVHAQATAARAANPRLASLNIEIWPEYDRPAALVILRGALAESVKLPAAVSLRLPKSSGGAVAVAYSTTADGNLLNLKYESATAGEFITLKFEMPERFFHVEFYDPIGTTAPARNFRYAWPGDFAADRVAVVVQEPAAASDIAVEPKLDGASTGQNGLHYRSAELGALEAGKALPIAVRYTKADARPSAEILKPKVSDTPLAPAAAAAASPHGAAVAAASGGWPEWALPLAGLILLGLGGGALIVWQWRRASRQEAAAGRACAKCGATQAPGDRFCGKCGAKMA